MNTQLRSQDSLVAKQTYTCFMLALSPCRWSVGYDGSPIHFIDNSTLVYGSGNGLCLVNRSGKHVKSLPSHGSGVGPVATAPQASTIMYAESTLNPKVFAVSYPSCELIATFRGTHVYLHSCFSRCVYTCIYMHISMCVTLQMELSCSMYRWPSLLVARD